jgi:hypothetical protein
MANHIIPNDNGKGFHIISASGDIEYTDPIKSFHNRLVSFQALLFEKLLLSENPAFDIATVRKVSAENAEEFWNEYLTDLTNAEIPEGLVSVLRSTSKKEQEKCLRNLQLTPQIWMTFIFKAFKDYGFTYSEYTSEQIPKDIDKTDLPRVIKIDPETREITKTGKTSLTDGQLRKVLDQRKVVAAKFLDKGSDWHCFFITYKSIGGQESWQDGQPHFHYISDKFGISRNDAVAQFKGDKYPSTNFHIALLGYGNQPNNKPDFNS